MTNTTQALFYFFTFLQIYKAHWYVKWVTLYIIGNIIDQVVGKYQKLDLKSVWFNQLQLKEYNVVLLSLKNLDLSLYHRGFNKASLYYQQAIIVQSYNSTKL